MDFQPESVRRARLLFLFRLRTASSWTMLFELISHISLVQVLISLPSLPGGPSTPQHLSLDPLYASIKSDESNMRVLSSKVRAFPHVATCYQLTMISSS